METPLLSALESAVVGGAIRTARHHHESRLELRCSACGYGVVVRSAPDECPMCRSADWEHSPRVARRAGLQSA